MKQFKDREGTTWDVDVNIANAKRVRDLLGFDLVPSTSDDAEMMVDRLLTDRYLLVDVIYVLCKPQADHREVDDERFGQLMAGDAIDHATTALLEALVDFFPNARDRAMMGRVLRKMNEAIDHVRDRMESELDGVLDSKADQAIQEAMLAFHRRNVSGTPSTASPASSESTQAA